MHKENLKLLIRALKSGKFDFGAGFSPILNKLLPDIKCNCGRLHVGPICKVFKNRNVHGVITVQGLSLLELRHHSDMISILKKELATY